MTKRKWTPGPWEADGEFVDGADGSAIYTALGYDPDNVPLHDEIQKANASLIAAAPDLYEALEGAVEAMEAAGMSCHDERAAIAKARGEK